MKIWRRIIAATLLLLICGNAIAIENTGGVFVEFDTLLTDEMGKSQTEWFSTSFNRATLTICLAIDLKLVLGDDFDFEEMLTSPTFVGEASNMLIVVGSNDESMIAILYRPTTNQRKYTVAEFSEELLMPFSVRFISEQCGDNFFVNDAADIETSMGLFAKAIEE